MSSKSKVSLFKAAISLTWADGNVSQEERERLHSYINQNIHLSDEDRAELIKNLDEKINIDDALKHITDPQDRAYLIDIASSIFAIDGIYCDDEKMLYEKIFEHHLKTIDVDALKKEIAQWGIQTRKNREIEEQEYIKLLEESNSAFSKKVPIINKLEVLLYKIEKKLG